MSSDRKKPGQQKLVLSTAASGTGKTAAVAGDLTVMLEIAYEENLWDISLCEAFHEDAAEVEADLAEMSAYADGLRARSDFRESAQTARFCKRLSDIEKLYREHLHAISGAVIDLPEQQGDASADYVLSVSQVAMRESSNGREHPTRILVAVPSSPIRTATSPTTQNSPRDHRRPYRRVPPGLLRDVTPESPILLLLSGHPRDHPIAPHQTPEAFRLRHRRRSRPTLHRQLNSHRPNDRVG